MATKTAVIVLCEEAVLICAIPPLVPQPPDFYDHNPTPVSPLFTIPFPDGIVLHSDFIQWKTISSWYFGSSQPLYFDMLCRDSKLHRFKIMLKPDLSTAALHVVITSELTPLNFEIVYLGDYRICEETLVFCWSFDVLRYNPPSRRNQYRGVCTGSTSARFSNVTTNDCPAAKMILTEFGLQCKYILCPASGRFVLLDHIDGVAVLDIF